MKAKKPILSLIAALLLCFCSVISVFAAVSFLAPPRAQRQFIFEPGLSKQIVFEIGGAEHIDTYIAGDLLEYATLTDPDPQGGPRKIYLSFKLPDSLAPGYYKFSVGAREIATGVQGNVGGLAAIQAAVEIFVLKDEKYLEFNFASQDVNVNEIGRSVFDLRSYTKQNISSVQGFVEIYDSEGKVLVATAQSPVSSLESGKTKTIYANYSTIGLEPSPYKARGRVVYDGIDTLPQESNFKIGELNVKFISCPETLLPGTINKFPVKVMSGWNGLMRDIYAVVSIPQISSKGFEFQTEHVSIDKFVEKDLLGYLDATSLKEGNYEAIIRIFSGDIEQEVGRGSCSFVLESPVNEEDERAKPKFALSTTALLIIVIIVLLILFNIIFFVIYKRSGKKSKEDKKASAAHATEEKEKKHQKSKSKQLSDDVGDDDVSDDDVSDDKKNKHQTGQ